MYLSVICLLTVAVAFVPQNSALSLPVESKEGSCLPPPPYWSPVTCAHQCSSDWDCDSDLKCCFNGCGNVCEKPIQRGCPRIDFGQCKDECFTDSNCPNDSKCCFKPCERRRTCEKPATKTPMEGQGIFFSVVFVSCSCLRTLKGAVNVGRASHFLFPYIGSGAPPWTREGCLSAFSLRWFRVHNNPSYVTARRLGGEVCVGVRPALPVDGVTMVLGNDIAVPVPPWSVSQSDLVHEQKADGTLRELWEMVCSPTEMQSDWEEALPWMLLSAREVVQESTGFSPNDLVFSHKVRGPLALLQDNWRESDPPSNLIDFVNGFRYRLYKAQEVAKDRLSGVQGKMKKLYDRHSVYREFLPGDQVLALLPLVTSPFQAKFSGPYSVKEKLSDLNYLICTPERRSKTQLCHVNLLKPYVSRDHVKDQVVKELPNVHPQCLSVPSSAVAELDGEEPPDPGEALVTGRLKNKEFLETLESSLMYWRQLSVCS
ncbi:hypothetical protein WMY93_030459 [Mugilogobius chulae]|uniref:WAP domain-containing protein n=1 Tax=Mugilogobius chulae TaxID=88201 RepID=A0AAW0MJX7_9GOBI